LAPRIGQKAPDFSLPDSENRVRTLSELASDGPVVVAFFAFSFSGVCDREMCAFRDDLPSFGGAKVVGVSVDSAFALKAFAQTYNLPFPLLSDFNRKAAKLYGVLEEEWAALGYRGVARRSVFIVDGKGVLRYRWAADLPTDEPPYAEVARVAQKLAR
jgi:peroxiredoxin